MPTYKNAELVDDIRHDALLLMKENPNLAYNEAYDAAREKLIGDQTVKNFTFHRPTVEFNIPYHQSSISKSEKNTVSTKSFHDEITEVLSSIININEFSQEQLEEYYIAHNMGVDISSFANSVFNVAQIKFLSIMLCSGKDISKYVDNPNFNPEQEFINAALQEEKQKKLENNV